MQSDGATAHQGPDLSIAVPKFQQNLTTVFAQVRGVRHGIPVLQRSNSREGRHGDGSDAGLFYPTDGLHSANVITLKIIAIGLNSSMQNIRVD